MMCSTLVDSDESFLQKMQRMTCQLTAELTGAVSIDQEGVDGANYPFDRRFRGFIEHAGASYKYEGESLGRGYDATRQTLKENTKLRDELLVKIRAKLNE